MYLTIWLALSLPLSLVVGWFIRGQRGQLSKQTHS